MAEYDITAELTQVLETYSDNVTEKVNEKAEMCADGLKKDLRAGSPKRTGEYAKTWQRKITKTLPGGAAEYTIYNSKNYQRTHLLEKGHAGPYGRGRVPAHEHIGPLEKKWNKEFLENVEEVIRNEK